MNLAHIFFARSFFFIQPYFPNKKFVKLTGTLTDTEWMNEWNIDGKWFFDVPDTCCICIMIQFWKWMWLQSINDRFFNGDDVDDDELVSFHEIIHFANVEIHAILTDIQTYSRKCQGENECFGSEFLSGQCLPYRTVVHFHCAIHEIYVRFQKILLKYVEFIQRWKKKTVTFNTVILRCNNAISFVCVSL